MTRLLAYFIHGTVSIQLILIKGDTTSCKSGSSTLLCPTLHGFTSFTGCDILPRVSECFLVTTVTWGYCEQDSLCPFHKRMAVVIRTPGNGKISNEKI